MRSVADFRNRTHLDRVRADNDGVIAPLAVPLLALAALVASTPLARTGSTTTSAGAPTSW